MLTIAQALDRHFRVKDAASTTHRAPIAVN